MGVMVSVIPWLIYHQGIMHISYACKQCGYNFRRIAAVRGHVTPVHGCLNTTDAEFS